MDGSYGPKEFTTDKNGEIDLSKLPTGAYVVTEKSCPGYVIDEETRSQTVVVNANDLQTLTFYNRPAGGLQLIKSDEDTGARIGGVKFEIRKVNGEVLGTYTTDRNGVISIPGAESGWYTITELKAADGYEVDPTPVNACVKDGETTTVEITNQRMASIMIHKVDAHTGRGIYGVKFVLYDSGKNTFTFGQVAETIEKLHILLEEAGVKKGDKIGEVGTTGNTTGNHLHFEFRLNGKYIDPFTYIKNPPISIIASRYQK